MSAQRYCRSCPPGSPTILSRYNSGDTCGACERREREDGLARLRAQMDAQVQAADDLPPTLAQTIAVLLFERGPLTTAQIAEAVEKPTGTITTIVRRMRNRGRIERATAIAGLHRYRLVTRSEDRAA